MSNLILDKWIKCQNNNSVQNVSAIDILTDKSLKEIKMENPILDNFIFMFLTSFFQTFGMSPSYSEDILSLFETDKFMQIEFDQKDGKEKALGQLIMGGISENSLKENKDFFEKRNQSKPVNEYLACIYLYILQTNGKGGGAGRRDSLNGNALYLINYDNNKCLLENIRSNLTKEKMSNIENVIIWGKFSNIKNFSHCENLHSLWTLPAIIKLNIKNGMVESFFEKKREFNYESFIGINQFLFYRKKEDGSIFSLKANEKLYSFREYLEYVLCDKKIDLPKIKKSKSVKLFGFTMDGKNISGFLNSEFPEFYLEEDFGIKDTLINLVAQYDKILKSFKSFIYKNKNLEQTINTNDLIKDLDLKLKNIISEILRDSQNINDENLNDIYIKLKNEIKEIILNYIDSLINRNESIFITKDLFVLKQKIIKSERKNNAKGKN